jgi:hypothetical protein
MSSNDETAEANNAADTSPRVLTGSPAERTRTLELALGDAWNTGGSISFRSLVGAAEAGQLLEAAVAELARCAFDTEFVPADLGGRLTSLDGLGQLVRPVSRRDIALVMACGLLSFGAASAVWVAGAAGQRVRLADSLLSGGQLAVSCLDAVEDIAGPGSAGGDPVRIEDGPDGPMGNGALVVVNEGARAELLVATISEPSAGADSLFLIDRSRLRTGQIAATNEVAGAGNRAIELTELLLSDVPLPATDLIGARGSAAEVRRAAEVLGYAAYCSALIGMADTALRVVARAIVLPPPAAAPGRSSGDDVETDPQPDGRALAEAGIEQHADDLALASSFIDLLVADSLSVAASRAAHLLPQECQLISAVTSYLVPKLLGESLYRLSVDLGYHVRVDAVANRTFSKTVNDVAAFTFGHVTASRYAAIAAGQLPRAAAGSWSGTPAAPPELFRPGAELPVLDAGQLTAAGGRDGIFSHLDLILRDLPASCWQADAAGPLVRTFCEQLQREIGELVPAPLEGTDQVPAVESDPGLPPAAERYALAVAGAVCVGIWAQARETGSFVAGSGWLAVALHGLLTRMDCPTWDLPPELSRGLTAEVLRRTREHISYDLYESELA